MGVFLCYNAFVDIVFSIQIESDYRFAYDIDFIFPNRGIEIIGYICSENASEGACL